MEYPHGWSTPGAWRESGWSHTDAVSFFARDGFARSVPGVVFFSPEYLRDVWMSRAGGLRRNALSDAGVSLVALE